jgi:drug/metabolite transporter (DMT)-like permease
VNQKRFLVPLVIISFALSRGVQRVLTALALEHLGPWTVAGASLAIATIIWIPFAAWKHWLIFDRRLWLRCAPLGIVNIAIPGVAFIAAQRFVSASAAALLVAAMPVVIAILAATLLGELLKKKAIMGIGVGTAGVITLTLGKGGSLTGQSWAAGLVLIAIGVLAASVVYVGWRKLLAEYRGVEILTPQLVVSTLVVVPVALVLEGVSPHMAAQLPTLAALAIVNYIIPQIAMFWLIARTTAVRAALSNYLAPLVAALLAVPVLHQRVTSLIVVGGVLIIAGAALVNTARQRTTRDRTVTVEKLGDFDQVLPSIKV